MFYMPDINNSQKLDRSLATHLIDSGAQKNKTIDGTPKIPVLKPAPHITHHIPVSEKDQIIEIKKHIQTTLMRSHRIDQTSFNSFLNHLSNLKINIRNIDTIINHWERWNQLVHQNHESQQTSTATNAETLASIFVHKGTIHETLIDYCNLSDRKIRDFMQFIKEKEEIKTDFSLLVKIRQQKLTPADIETYWNQYKASKIASLIKGFIPSKFGDSKMASEFTAFIIENNQDPTFIQRLFHHSFIPQPTIDIKTEQKINHQWINFKKTHVESDVTELLGEKNSAAIPSFLTYLFKHQRHLFQNHADLFERLNRQEYRTTTISELNTFWERYKKEDEPSPPHSPQYQEPTAPKNKPSDHPFDIRILDPFSWIPSSPATETPHDKSTPTNMNNDTPQQPKPPENCFDIQWLTEPITTILNCFGPR